MLVPTSPYVSAAPAAPNAAAKRVRAAQAAAVNTPRAEVQEAQEVWADCRLAYFGTRALFQHIERYIPKHPKERAIDYRRRATFTRFYNAFGRTVRGVAGLPFRRPPTYGDDIPALVREHCEDIDGEGTHLDVFARRLFEDGLTTGTVGILVDAPTVTGTLSKAQEEEYGARPYWRHVLCEDVVSWADQRINGRRRLVQLVLREATETLNGFATTYATSYRVYRHTESGITSQLYTEDVGADGVLTITEGVVVPLSNVTRIPYVPLLLGLQTSSMTAFTPLLDLLDTNLQHFVNSSDRNWLMHLCCFPTPVRKGSLVNPQAGNNPDTAQAQAKAVDVWGGNVMLRVPTDGDFYYREPSGSAFAPTGQEIEKLEQRMAALGLAFLASDTRAAETAEAKRLDAAVQNATLSASATALDDAVRQALALHAEFLKLATRKTGSGVWSGGTWTTSKDYEQQLLSPQMLDTYAKMEASGQLSLRTLWKVMAMLGALPEDFNPDDEEEAITTGGELTLPVVPPGANANGAPEDPEDPADSGDDDETLDEERNTGAPEPVMAGAGGA